MFSPQKKLVNAPASCLQVSHIEVPPPRKSRTQSQYSTFSDLSEKELEVSYIDLPPPKQSRICSLPYPPSDISYDDKYFEENPYAASYASSISRRTSNASTASWSTFSSGYGTYSHYDDYEDDHIEEFPQFYGAEYDERISPSWAHNFYNSLNQQPVSRATQQQQQQQQQNYAQFNGYYGRQNDQKHFPQQGAQQCRTGKISSGNLVWNEAKQCWLL